MNNDTKLPSNKCVIDGREVDVDEVFRDPSLTELIVVRLPDWRGLESPTLARKLVRATAFVIMNALALGCGGAEFTPLIGEDLFGDDAGHPGEASPGDDAAPEASLVDAKPDRDASADASPVDAAASDVGPDVNAPEVPPVCTPLTADVQCPGGRTCILSAGQVCAEGPGEEGCATIPAACACKESLSCACLLAAGARWGGVDAGAVSCTEQTAGDPVLVYP